MILTSDVPLDLGLTVTSGQLFHWTEENAQFKIIQDRTVLYARQVSQIQIEVQQAGKTMSRSELSELFGLNIHRKATLKHLQKDRFLAEFLPTYSGLTIMRQNPYECLISFMASAMSNIPRIMRNVQDLRAQIGTTIKRTEEKSFPSPKQIVELGELGLRKLGLGYRARYIATTCDRIVVDGIRLQEWNEKSTSDLTNSLSSFEGVGGKIAECTALFGFGRWDTFPVDVWVKRALNALDPELSGMSADKLCEWGKKRWGQNAGLAQQILFCAARNNQIPF
ncbi:MAG: DNA glycosylase [Candidatus Neomarinimicrobiota bacterium]|nr:DNA glycosylase [Candidatus Neomarinimicrobiota bacterium]